jgi:hypothetical protein
MMELMQPGIFSEDKFFRDACRLILSAPRGVDGGINYVKTVDCNDVCVNGMILIGSQV